MFEKQFKEAKTVKDAVEIPINIRFYAGKMGVGASLVVMGGFTVEPSTANVLDTDYNKISGLYACGNVMGGRFLGDYPVVLAGTSHGTCLCYGRLADYQAAANAKGVQT